MSARVFALLLSALAACKPGEVPVSNDTAELAEKACANLRTLECPEGKGSPSGAVSCRDALVKASELRDLPLACWAAAESVPIAKGCGSLKCLR